jgi:hypothetical protein
MWNDMRRSQQVREARAHMLNKLGESSDAAALDRLRDLSSTGHGSGVVGEAVGLVLAIAWFATRT